MPIDDAMAQNAGADFCIGRGSAEAEFVHVLGRSDTQILFNLVGLLARCANPHTAFLMAEVASKSGDALRAQLGDTGRAVFEDVRQEVVRLVAKHNREQRGHLVGRSGDIPMLMSALLSSVGDDAKALLERRELPSSFSMLATLLVLAERDGSVGAVLGNAASGDAVRAGARAGQAKP